MAPVIMGNADRPELGEELTNSFCRTDPDIASHFARVTFFSDNRQDLASVGLPALILQCSDDVIAPYAVGEYVHRHMPGSQLVVMKATGHCPNLSAPGRYLDAIRGSSTRSRDFRRQLRRVDDALSRRAPRPLLKTRRASICRPSRTAPSRVNRTFAIGQRMAPGAVAARCFNPAPSVSHLLRLIPPCCDAWPPTRSPRVIKMTADPSIAGELHS